MERTVRLASSSEGLGRLMDVATEGLTVNRDAGEFAESAGGDIERPGRHRQAGQLSRLWTEETLKADPDVKWVGRQPAMAAP